MINLEDKVKYNELSPSLQAMLDDKLEENEFVIHDNDMIRHIIQEERNYWNSVEGICKRYTDDEIAKLKEWTKKKIQDETNRAKNEEASLWEAINSLSDEIDNVSNKMDDIQDNYNKNAICTITKYQSPDFTIISNILSGSCASKVRFSRAFDLTASGNDYMGGTNINCKVEGRSYAYFSDVGSGHLYAVVPTACPVHFRPNADYGNTHAINVSIDYNGYSIMDVIQHFQYGNKGGHGLVGILLTIIDIPVHGTDISLSVTMDGTSVYTSYTPPDSGGWEYTTGNIAINNSKSINLMTNTIEGGGITDAQLATYCGIFDNINKIPWFN